MKHREVKRNGIDNTSLLYKLNVFIFIMHPVLYCIPAHQNNLHTCTLFLLLFYKPAHHSSFATRGHEDQVPLGGA